MPDGTHSARQRDTLLRLPIGELVEWHLVLTCSVCREERNLHLKNLVARYGPDLTLIHLVPRLRCKLALCRQPPAIVRLRNRLPAHPGPPLVDVILKTSRP